MGTFLAGMMIYLIVSWYVFITKPYCLAKGKLFTRPLCKKWPHRFHAPSVRWYQTIFWAIFVSVIGPLLPITLMYSLYWVGITLLYVDDYYSDTDFKKKWKEVRNKIKWKMQLPAPVKVRTNAY